MHITIPWSKLKHWTIQFYLFKITSLFSVHLRIFPMKRQSNIILIMLWIWKVAALKKKSYWLYSLTTAIVSLFREKFVGPYVECVGYIKPSTHVEQHLILNMWNLMLYQNWYKQRTSFDLILILYCNYSISILSFILISFVIMLVKCFWYEKIFLSENNFSWCFRITATESIHI